MASSAAAVSSDKSGSPKGTGPSTPLNIRHPRQRQAPGSSHSDPSAGNSDSHESYSGPTDHDLGSSEISSGEIGTSGARHGPARNLAGAGHRYLPSFSGNSSTAYDSEDAGAPIGNGSPTRSAGVQRWANSVLVHSSSSSSAGSFMPSRARLNTFGRPGGAPLSSNSNRLRRQATLVPTNESREGGAPIPPNNVDGDERQTLAHDLETPRVSTFAAAATSDASFVAVPKHTQGVTSTGTGYRSVTNFPSQSRGGFDLPANGRQLYTGTTAAQSPRGLNRLENFGRSAIRPSNDTLASTSHGFRDDGGTGTDRAISHYAAVPPPSGFYRQENDHRSVPPTPPRGFNRQEIERHAISSPGIATFPGQSPRRLVARESIQPFPAGHDATLRNAELAGVITRADNTDDAVVDPQAIYPPEACIFVANLADSKDDSVLMAAVTREFSRFGTVFVKIRRDERTGLMPFAFCQFTNRQDADNALVHGRGIYIHGRPCRTERAKSSRWFVIFRRDGDILTLGEARRVMQEYGHVSQVAMHEDHSSVKVQFENFHPQQRDFQLVAEHHQVYQVEPLTERRRDTRDDQDMRFLQEYDLARRSVYVSQIPEDADEDELRAHFSLFGRVASVLIISPPRGQRFSFVEFVHAVSVDNALANTANQPIRGRYAMRVERKFCKANARRMRSMQSIEGNETNETTQVAPTTPGSSMPWSRRNRPENFAGASPHSSITPQHTTSPHHMFAGRGLSSGGRVAPSPARFDGGFSIAGPRTTPARPPNRNATQPSTTPSDPRATPIVGPLRYTGGPSPALPSVAGSGIAAHHVAAPANTAQRDMMPLGTMPPMVPYPYQYVAVDPFTRTPAFVVNAPAMDPLAPRDEPAGQERGTNAFNNMLNRLATGQGAAQGMAQLRVEDVTDAECDTDNEVGEKGKRA